MKREIMTKPLRVLIIEDSEDESLLIIHKLRRGGYDVIFKQVNTPEKFIEALDKQPWDIIIADYVLSYFRRLEALKWIQKRGIDIPYIIISNKIDEEAVVEAIKSGAHDYIIKCNLKRLIPIVERELLEAKVRYERKYTHDKLIQTKIHLESSVTYHMLESKKANEKLIKSIRELEHHNHEINLLSKMMELLQVSFSTQEVYTIVSQCMQKLFPHEKGMVYVFNQPQDLQDPSIVWDGLEGRKYLFAQDECWALRRRQPYQVDDLDSAFLCPCFTANNQHFLPYLCIPMIAGNETLGIIHLQFDQQERNPGEKQYQIESKRQLAITVASHIALALASTRLREALCDKSTSDPLTHLFNRRYLEEMLERELYRAILEQQPLGLIMFDVNYSGRFHEIYGREAKDVKDTVLRSLGNFIKTYAYGSGTVCRYSHDKFIIVLIKTTLDDTQKYAGELRSKVKELHIQYHGQSPGNITLSLGVAAFPEHGTTIDDLLHAADRALYRAKAEGRNRIEIAQAPYHQP